MKTKLDKLPKVKIKTTENPLRCPMCGGAVTNVRVVKTTIHDGGFREYLLRSEECNHLMRTTIV